MHKAIQKRFFELITHQAPLFAQHNNPIQTYKELIHYRFKEVISSAFPRMWEILDENLLDKLITKFIQSSPQSPLIWQMPNEFRQFLSKQTSLRAYPFMDDMLWFEWIEIELFMKNYLPPQRASFQWDQAYELSESAVIKGLNFPVYLEEGYEHGGIHWLVVFYHFDDHEIHYQEITPFLEQFIIHLSRQSAHDALQTLCDTYEINAKEVKELLSQTLESFAQNAILIPKDLSC